MRKIDLKKQTQDYEESLSSVIKKIEESKHQAITTVNKLLIELYWFIGETIVNLQEKSEWGGGVVEKLSQDLRMKYPEQSGFSVQNLWYMKKCYLTYHDKPILQTLSGELGFFLRIWQEFVFYWRRISTGDRRGRIQN
jgi:predicted nuclease of restriction endonuclease-like (RecB) superfamily